MRRLLMRGAAVLALALALSALTLASLSSEELIQAEPHPDGVTAETPHNVVLTFDRGLALLRDAHHVEVLDEAGHRVDSGEATVSTYSTRTLIVPLDGHAEGELEVRYSVLFSTAAGGLDQVRGSYTFTVNPTIAGLEAPSAAASETKSSQGLVLWTVAILIGVAFVGALLYFLRLATGNARSSLEPQNRTPFND